MARVVGDIVKSEADMHVSGLGDDVVELGSDSIGIVLSVSRLTMCVVTQSGLTVWMPVVRCDTVVSWPL